MEAAHDGLIDDIDVSSAGISSYGNDGLLVITDATGTVLRRIGIDGRVNAIEWVDADTVAVANATGVILLDVEPVDLADLVEAIVTRELTEPECETYLEMSCEQWSERTRSTLNGP